MRVKDRHRDLTHLQLVTAPVPASAVPLTATTLSTTHTRRATPLVPHAPHTTIPPPSYPSLPPMLMPCHMSCTHHVQDWEMDLRVLARNYLLSWFVIDFWCAASHRMQHGSTPQQHHRRPHATRPAHAVDQPAASALWHKLTALRRTRTHTHAHLSHCAGTYARAPLPLSLTATPCATHSSIAPSAVDLVLATGDEQQSGQQRSVRLTRITRMTRMTLTLTLTPTLTLTLTRCG